jgi:hypothetical protein
MASDNAAASAKRTTASKLIEIRRSLCIKREYFENYQ